jgi:hypothetical protein
MKGPISATDLSANELSFVTAMQSIQFGWLECLQIRHGELVLDPSPLMIRDVKFCASASNEHPALPSAAMRPQVAEFFGYVRKIEAGEIRKLHIRHGIPFAMELQVPGVCRG